MRQVDGSHDPNALLPDFNPTIDLPPGARPFTIAVDARDKYAYITDRNSYGGNGLIYVLDIDPNSATFHQVVEHISVDSVGNGLGQMSIDPSGKYLYVINPNSTPGRGEIVVIDLSTNQKIYAFPIDGYPTGIKFAPKTDLHTTQVLFTQRQDDARGVGVLTIVDDDFAGGTINYIPLGLGSNVDYFDVNEGVGVTITKDGKYGFVAGRNSRN
jgi:YVTN family beta-propeller protein